MAEDGAEQGLVGSVSDEDLLVGVQDRGSGKQLSVELGESVDKSGVTLARLRDISGKLMQCQHVLTNPLVYWFMNMEGSFTTSANVLRT